MHGYPVMQVVQYSVPPCTWGPPTDTHRPPSTGMSLFFYYMPNIFPTIFVMYLRPFSVVYLNISLI